MKNFLNIYLKSVIDMAPLGPTDPLHGDALWQLGEAIARREWRLLREPVPRLEDARPPRRQHAVLQAVEAPPMNGREELARHQAQYDAGREVVLVDAVAELEVLVEHGAQGERDGLRVKFYISGCFHLGSLEGKGKPPHFENYV